MAHNPNLHDLTHHESSIAQWQSIPTGILKEITGLIPFGGSEFFSKKDLFHIIKMILYKKMPFSDLGCSWK